MRYAVVFDNHATDEDEITVWEGDADGSDTALRSALNQLRVVVVDDLDENERRDLEPEKDPNNDAYWPPRGQR